MVRAHLVDQQANRPGVVCQRVEVEASQQLPRRTFGVDAGRRAMPVRDKGPLFIIYPFDSSAELRSEPYYSRSAWQLRTIEVR